MVRVLHVFFFLMDVSSPVFRLPSLMERDLFCFTQSFTSHAVSKHSRISGLGVYDEGIPCSFFSIEMCIMPLSCRLRWKGASFCQQDLES